MAEFNRQFLEGKRAYYANYLKDYEVHKNAKLHSQIKQQLPRVSCWKQPVFPNKVVVNSMHSSSLNHLYSHNKLQPLKFNSSTNFQNNRTVLYYQNKNFKTNYAPSVQKHTTRSIKPPVMSINKRLINENVSNKYKLTLSNAKNNLDKQKTALTCASKNISSTIPQHLIKEIVDVTKQLKTMSKNMICNTRDTISKQSVPKSSKSINFNDSNNCKIIGRTNQFSKNNINSAFKISSNSSVNRSFSQISYLKLNGGDQMKGNSSHCSRLISSKKPSKSLHLDVHSNGNDKSQMGKMKICNLPVKGFVTKDLTVNLEQKCTVPQFSEKVKQTDCKVNAPNTNVVLHNKVSSVQPKTNVFRREVINKKLNLAKEPSKYKVTGKECVKGKSPVVTNVKTKSTFMYSKINGRNSFGLNKNQLKTSLVYSKTPLNVKRIKRNVNLKYKVINCTNSSLKVVNVKNNERSKINSPLLLDKSDPDYKLLRESSAIDKLEQELLAKSSSFTNSLKSTFKENQVKDQSTLSRNSPKFCLKKIPLKRSKVLASKYKVVNKSLKTPQNYTLKRKSCTPFKNSANKLCNNKVVCSKFAVINKQSKPTSTSPVLKGKSILVKRLYKSKKAIINKNSSPSNVSAKIKYKYLALSKRRSPRWQKHAQYSRTHERLQKFKGSFIANRLHLKHLRYQKRLVNRHRVTRKFLSYRTNNQRFRTNRWENIWLKRKSNQGHIGISKYPKKVVVGGKVYIKAGHTLKAVSPSSTNLASRVLHRSINRVLIASTKKSLRKVNTYCMFYNRFGRCNRGVKCTYIHDPSKIAVCTRFLRGTCKSDRCPFSHEISPGKMAICTFFLLGSCEKENCPYRHEKLSPDAELCKAFVQGYCPEGKECKKAHLLICPKFIQGDCDKGDSCAYPHPPQKEKKNVQKEVVEEKDDQKFDHIWLEKVARYFQPNQESSLKSKRASDESKINQVLPKRKRIDEQPAFIPLCDTPVSPKMEKSLPVD